MLKANKKRGRPQACYRTSWDEHVQGLSRRRDGRWRATVGGKVITFVEPDEHKAVQMYREATQAAGPVLVDFEGGEAGDFEEIAAQVEREQPLLIEVEADGRIKYRRTIPEKEFWARVREELLARPAYAAKMTGIQELGFLDQIKRPAPSPTLKELGDLYTNKPGLSPNEASRSKLFWAEFTKAAGVQTVRELTHDQVQMYEAQVEGRNLSPKSDPASVQEGS